MCNVDVVFFAMRSLRPEDVEGRRVLDVGSLDVNGSLRPLIESWRPAEYVGVDIARGPGVDVICSADALVEHFGPARFDVVVSTELIEHIRDWKTAVANIKRVCAPRGWLLITTRSYGFRYHAYPHDYWRYEIDDMRRIFSDCEVLDLMSDPRSPGVFMKARKPEPFVENELGGVELYSIVLGRRKAEITDRDLKSTHAFKLRMRERMKALALRAGSLVLRAPR
jgi:SAM-dependent methyltransferase